MSKKDMRRARAAMRSQWREAQRVVVEEAVGKLAEIDEQFKLDLEEFGPLPYLRRTIVDGDVVEEKREHVLNGGFDKTVTERSYPTARTIVKAYEAGVSLSVLEEAFPLPTVLATETVDHRKETTTIAEVPEKALYRDASPALKSALNGLRIVGSRDKTRADRIGSRKRKP